MQLDPILVVIGSIVLVSAGLGVGWFIHGRLGKDRISRAEEKVQERTSVTEVAPKPINAKDAGEVLAAASASAKSSRPSSMLSTGISRKNRRSTLQAASWPTTSSKF